jgi:hypothetical protein
MANSSRGKKATNKQPQQASRKQETETKASQEQQQ